MQIHATYTDKQLVVDIGTITGVHQLLQAPPGAAFRMGLVLPRFFFFEWVDGEDCALNCRVVCDGNTIGAR